MRIGWRQIEQLAVKLCPVELDRMPVPEEKAEADRLLRDRTGIDWEEVAFLLNQ